MLGVWNALVLGGGGAAFIRRKQLAEWITGGDNLQRGQVRSTDDGDAWEAFLAEHLELEPPRRSRIAARPRVLTGESAIRPSHWWRASGLDLSPVFGLCQRPDVLTSSSAVMLGESGTEPLGALSISARRPIRARSSSRKRVQSARNSSLTKSPGRSGPRAGGGWGCSVGPEITPHLGVERWISRDLSCPQTPQPWELSAGDAERDSTRSNAACGPLKGGDAPRNRRKEREPHPRARRRANPSGARAASRTPSHSASARSPARDSGYASSLASPSRKKAHALAVKISAGRDAQRPTGSFRGQALSILSRRSAPDLRSLLLKALSGAGACAVRVGEGGSVGGPPSVFLKLRTPAVDTGRRAGDSPAKEASLCLPRCQLEEEP